MRLARVTEEVDDDAVCRMGDCEKLVCAVTAAVDGCIGLSGPCAAPNPPPPSPASGWVGCAQTAGPMLFILLFHLGDGQSFVVRYMLHGYSLHKTVYMYGGTPLSLSICSRSLVCSSSTRPAAAPSMASNSLEVQLGAWRDIHSYTHSRHWPQACCRRTIRPVRSMPQTCPPTSLRIPTRPRFVTWIPWPGRCLRRKKDESGNHSLFGAFGLKTCQFMHLASPPHGALGPHDGVQCLEMRLLR